MRKRITKLQLHSKNKKNQKEKKKRKNKKTNVEKAGI